MKADCTVSILLSSEEIKKDGKTVRGWTLLCNPQDNIPEVQGRLFNHTADYAISQMACRGRGTSAWTPAQGSVRLPVQPHVHLLVSGVSPQ